MTAAFNDFRFKQRPLSTRVAFKDGDDDVDENVNDDDDDDDGGESLPSCRRFFKWQQDNGSADNAEVALPRWRTLILSRDEREFRFV